VALECAEATVSVLLEIGHCGGQLVAEQRPSRLDPDSTSAGWTQPGQAPENDRMGRPVTEAAASRE
jgi:hypothetical protein